jgi:hypothetical protein
MFRCRASEVDHLLPEALRKTREGNGNGLAGIFGHVIEQSRLGAADELAA